MMNPQKTFAAVLLALLVVAPSSLSLAQTADSVQLLDWIEVTEPAGLGQQLHNRLDKLTAFFLRVTSPDVSRDSRHLWRMAADGTHNCLLSNDTGVRFPRWSAGGDILYLVEADTNNDGRMDFNDDFLIRVVSAGGGGARTVAQGKSAVWSPDGHFIAFVRDGKIMVSSLRGEVLPLGNAVPGGKLIAANSLNPAAREFWAVDTRSEAKETLPGDLTQKYLWIGALSPLGTRIVFASTMKTALEIRAPQPNSPTKEIAHGDFHFLDPAWSPDETQIVYVSDRPKDGTACWN